VPKYGGVLIDMKKMDKILEINEADLAICMA
jgi:FAD/FMN-containing dehydrogenase